MPVFFTDTFLGFQVGVWKISEDEVALESGMNYRSLAFNGERRLQQLAARKMLFHFAPELDLNRIETESSGKPYDKLNKLMFSLSHTRGYAAAMLGVGASAGIDIEIISERASRVAPRFLNEIELKYIQQPSIQSIQGIHSLCWSIKETVYKWWGKGGVDFTADINIKNLALDGFAEVECILGGIQRIQIVKTTQINNTWLTFMTGMH